MKPLCGAIVAGFAVLLLAILVGGCQKGKISSDAPGLQGKISINPPDLQCKTRIDAQGKITIDAPDPQSKASEEPSGPDLLEKRSKELAGPNAVDCGRVPIRGNPKTATDCALAAQQAGKPLRVRYDLQGFDSAVAVAIVRTHIGTVGALMYDSDPMGGGGRAREVVYPKRCPEPVHLWVNPSGRINCFQKESSPPRDAMSPNAEPY